MTSYRNQSIAMLIAVSLFLVGCGNSALKANVSIANAMLEIQSTSGPLIRGLRINASVAAARDVHDSGGDEVAALTAARQTGERWMCAVEGHRIYSSTVSTYIDALVLWRDDSRFEWSNVIPFIGRVFDAYRALGSCLASLGSDVLPGAPSFLNFLPTEQERKLP